MLDALKIRQVLPPPPPLLFCSDISAVVPQLKYSCVLVTQFPPLLITLLPFPLYLSLHPLPMLWWNTPRWRSEGKGMTERESKGEKKTDQKMEERKCLVFLNWDVLTAN